MTAKVSQLQRSDTVRTRERIRATARDVLGTRGLEMSSREIARLCGVSVSTLYRHFPSRVSLVDAVLADEVASCQAELDEAASEPDPGAGLRLLLAGFTARQVRGHGFNELLLGNGPGGERFAEVRREHSRALEALMARAGASGALRPGVHVGHVRSGLLAIAGLRGLGTDRLETVAQMVSDLILAGLLVSGPNPNEAGSSRDLAM